jgi:hypothetical protein
MAPAKGGFKNLLAVFEPVDRGPIIHFCSQAYGVGCPKE